MPPMFLDGVVSIQVAAGKFKFLGGTVSATSVGWSDAGSHELHNVTSEGGGAVQPTSRSLLSLHAAYRPRTIAASLPCTVGAFASNNADPEQPVRNIAKSMRPTKERKPRDSVRFARILIRFCCWFNIDCRFRIEMSESRTRLQFADGATVLPFSSIGPTHQRHY